jgi:hypothetical protein
MKLRIDSPASVQDRADGVQTGLDARVNAQSLTLKFDGTYIRLTEGRISLRRSAKAELNRGWKVGARLE